MGSKDDALEPEQLEKMIEATNDIHDRLYLYLAGILGMRASEIANMRKSWVSFQRNRIKIPEQDPHTGWEPKSTAGARTIPFGAESTAKETIKSFFGAYDTVPHTRQTIHRRIKDIAERAGIIRNVYPHSLRATAAIAFADRGISASNLCAIMGWEDLRTARKYIRASGRSLEKELKETNDKAWI